MGKRMLTLWVLAIVLASGSLAGGGERSPIGKKIDEFAARDFEGKPVALSDFSQSKLIVVAFLGTECPLAKLYAPRLAELSTEFPDAAFVGINYNQQDSITELAHYARE